MQEQIQKLMNNKVTRREFLTMVGAPIVSMIGITATLKNLGNAFGPTEKKSSSDLTYGNSTYGGGGASNKPRIL